MDTPPPAELARTVVEHGGPARLRIAFAPCLGNVPYVPDESGEPWLLLPADRTAGWCGRDLAGVLHVEDSAGSGIAATGVTVLVGGRLAPVSAAAQRQVALALAAVRPLGDLLDVGHGLVVHRLAVSEIRLTGTVTATVDLPAYVTARPDPLRPHATRILGHLAQAHRAQLAAIVSAHLGVRRALADVLPLALDRFGLVIAYRDAPDGELRRVRVPFQAPIRRLAALGAALRAITPCACRAALPY